MDPSEFIRLLKTDHYAPADLEEVNDICRNYPMFNLAHMLKVRIREALGQDKEAELRVAAVYSTDRRKLYQLVTEVVKPQFPEPEELMIPQEQEGIQFSDEPHHQADVIIEQHAPYAAPEPTGDLLVLDEDDSEDAFTLDPDPEDITSEDPTTESDDPHSEDPATESDDPHSEDPATESDDHPSMNPAPVASVHVERNKVASDNNDLIQSFIVEEPGPIRGDMKSSLKGDVSLSSIREHDGFITDTLAKIYVKQRLYAKAIYAYEKLSLKYPEKSAYFAAQIEKIRNINHS